MLGKVSVLFSFTSWTQNLSLLIIYSSFTSCFFNVLNDAYVSNGQGRRDRMLKGHSPKYKNISCHDIHLYELCQKKLKSISKSVVVNSILIFRLHSSIISTILTGNTHLLKEFACPVLVVHLSAYLPLSLHLSYMGLVCFLMGWGLAYSQ